MTPDRLLEAFDRLNVWKKHGARAPHKPLLLLLVLGRVWRGEPRLASYGRDVHQSLKKLLKDFGPPRSRLYPELPFWHLRSDRLPPDHLQSESGALWELAGAEGLTMRPGPTAAILKRQEVKGGLVEPLHRLLCRQPGLVHEAANRLLHGHFPESMHDAIRERVGLPRAAAAGNMMVREGEAQSPQPRRDPEFRDAVLRAYERRCAVCDFDLRIADDLFGLEAAHIQWHAAGGPDSVPNGLALCSFHHKALDRGVIGLDRESGEYRLLVSNELTGRSPAFAEVLDLRGRPLRSPQENEQRPAPEYVGWHRREVFRGAPRSRPRP